MNSLALIQPTTDSRRYYLGAHGKRIMDAENFGPAIRDHLDREAAGICDILDTGRYRTFVELGCDRARSLMLAERYRMEYLGIDCREELRPFQKSLRARRPRTARIEIGCLNQLPQYLGADQMARSDTILCVFPFNLIGNIGDVEPALRPYATAGLDIVISSFNSETATTEARQRYYARCNIENLVSLATAEGMLFTNFEEFFSVSYHENTLHTLLSRSGYDVVQAQNTQTNLLLHCRPSTRLRAAQGPTPWRGAGFKNARQGAGATAPWQRRKMT